MSNAEYHKIFGDNAGIPCDDAWKNKVLERINESQSLSTSEAEYVPVEWDPSFPTDGAVIVFDASGVELGAYIIRYPDGSYREVSDDWYHTMEIGQKYLLVSDEITSDAQSIAEEIFSYYLYVGKDCKFTDEDHGSIERGGRRYSNTTPVSYESVLSERFFNGEYDDMLNSYANDDYKEWLKKERDQLRSRPNFYTIIEDYHAAIDVAISQNKHLLVVARDMPPTIRRS